ncbi:hypothetical protein ACHAPF_011411 [Botrytis cinerea]
MSFDPKKARNARSEKAASNALLAKRLEHVLSATDYTPVNTSSDPNCTDYDTAYPSNYEMQFHRPDVERTYGLFRSLDNHENKYIGTIGRKADLGNATRINILRCNPLRDPPYQGIRFFLPRRVDNGYTYLDTIPHEQYIEFHFHADDFDLSYIVLDEKARKTVQSLTASKLPDGPLISIKFVLKARGFSVHGFNNGAFISEMDSSKLLHDHIALWKDQGEFEYVTSFYPFWVQYFDVTAQMFAKFGSPPGFKQYSKNGSPDGMPKVQWDVTQLLKKQNDQPAMFPYPDFFPAVNHFPSWSNFAVRYFFGTVQEHLWINQYCEELRDTPIPARWYKKPGCTKTFAISLTLPQLSIDRGTMLAAESELYVHFRPRSAEERQPKGDTHGWEAFVEPNNLIHHDGNVLLTCSRTMHQNDDDTKFILADEAPNGTLSPTKPFILVYLRVVEAETTVKARVRALIEWDPDHPNSSPSPPSPPPPPSPHEFFQGSSPGCSIPLEDDFDIDMSDTFTKVVVEDTDPDVGLYGDEAEHVVGPDAADNDDDEPSFGQVVMESLGYGHKPSTRIGNRTAIRQVLLGNGVYDSNQFFHKNMTFDLSNNNLNFVFGGATDKQTIKLKSIVGNVPMGILPVIGPPGTGKTSMTISFIHCAILAKKKTLILSTTNAATTNIFKRMMEKLEDPEVLHVRLHTSNMELLKFRTYDVTKPFTHPNNLGTPSKVYNFEGSLAYRMLQVIGVISCHGNCVLENLKHRHTQLLDVVTFLSENHNKPEVKSTSELSEAQEKFNALSKACAVDVLTHCSTVSATTIAAVTPWLAWYRAVFELLVIDEAGCVPLLEALLHINPFVRILVVGDTKQISPYIASSAVRYVEPPKRRVNSFSDQLGQTILHNLQHNGWPCLFLDEQLRTEPGLSKITSSLIYDGLISDYQKLVLTQWGIGFEKYALQYLRGNMLPFELTPSPKGLVYPVFVDMRNTFSHKQTFGTSRGNTYTANYAIKICVDMSTSITGLTDEDLLIITPYKYQVALLMKSITKLGRKFQVSTTDSYQGMEAKMVIFDTVCAASQRQMPKFGDDVSSHLHIFDFIADPRRFNMGLSRMKSGLIILADSLIFSDIIVTDLWKDTYSMLKKDGRVIVVDGLKVHGWKSTFVPTVSREIYSDMKKRQMQASSRRKEQVQRQFGQRFS